MNGKRYNIGLLINELESGYSLAVCRGAAELAERMDFNLYIFPGNGLHSRINTVNENIYSSQHGTIINYASKNILDAVIIAFDRIFEDTRCPEAAELLRRFEGIPIVTLNHEEKGCGCVRYENRAAGLEELIGYIIQTHGCSKAAFVNGHTSHPDAAARLEAFKIALWKNGVVYDEDLVVSADFKGDSASRIKKLFADRDKMPRYICCANDHLAAETYKAAAEAGLKVGEDIFVTGYDNSPAAASLMPMLTTVSVSNTVVGVQAARLACEMIETGKPRTVVLDAVPVIRDSCGSCRSGKSPSTQKTESLLRRYCACYDILTGERTEGMLLGAIERMMSALRDAKDDDIDISELLDIFDRTARSLVPDSVYGVALCDIVRMLITLMSESSLCDSGKNRLLGLFSAVYSRMCMQLVGLSDRLMADNHSNRFFLNNIVDFVDFEPNMCLGKMMHQLRRLELRNSWLLLSPTPVRITDPTKAVTLDELCLKAYHLGSDCFVPLDTIKLSRSALFANKYMATEQRGTFLTAPLYTMNEQLGIVVFDLPVRFLGYVPVLERQLSAALETLSIFGQINDRIEDVESRNSVLRTIASEDALTGLLNRYGFFEHSENLARDPENAGKKALVAFVDMDNLKMTNDTFGHEAGDFALKLINRALVASFGTHSIIGRIGGDEFAVFTIPKEGEDGPSIRKKLREALEQLNKSSGKPYNVSLSIGFAV